MSELRNPHDLFFRETFSRPEIAQDFLQTYLPTQVVQHLDLSSLALQKDSFIDEELREHFSDLLYHVRQQNGEEANVYLLLEHKSSPDVWVALQLLRYMVRIWERARQEKAKTLPPIIPVVVYHGRTTWQIKETFDNLFEGPEDFRPYWPSFRYELQDLSRYSDEEVRGGLLTRASVLLLKYAFDPTLRHRLPTIVSLLAELALADEKSALEYLHMAFRYLSSAAPDFTAEDMRAALDETFTQDGGPTMTDFVAEWIEKGEQQGLEKSILRVLVRRFNRVPAGIEARLERMTIETLELVLDEAVLAADLADFDRRLADLEQ
jgi:predicted transposase/invertase (TIGR01784 family)